MFGGKHDFIFQKILPISLHKSEEPLKMESTKRNMHSIVFRIDAQKKKKIKANTPNVSKIDIKEKETTCGDNFFY